MMRRIFLIPSITFKENTLKNIHVGIDNRFRRVSSIFRNNCQIRETVSVPEI